MKFRTYALLALLVALSGITSHCAFASETSIKQFLGTVEGHWDGRGIETALLIDGSVTKTQIDLQLEFRNNFSGTYDETVISRNNSVITQDQNQFKPTGNNLILTQNGFAEFVRVIESTPLSLTYQFDRINQSTGGVYHWTYQSQLTPAHHLKIHNTVETNGTIVLDDLFDLIH